MKIEERSTWTDPLGGITSYSSRNKDTLIYSIDGKLIKVANARWLSSWFSQDYSEYSNGWNFLYDGNRLDKVEGPLITYQYNNEGLISTITAGQIIINFEYDEFSNCVNQGWERIDVASKYEQVITYEKATSNALYLWHRRTYQIIKSYEIFKLPPFSLLDQ